MSNFDFLKGNIEVIILNALYERDKYGYEIARDIKDRTNNSYEIKQPTLYAYLKRLESQDLIIPYWGEESSGGRRKYYKLTPTGKKACESYTSEWRYHKEVLDNLVVDSDEIAMATQEEVTPLFGTKSKRVRRPRELPNLVEQLNLSQKLAELSNKPTEQDSDNTPESVSVSVQQVATQSQVSFDDVAINTADLSLSAEQATTLADTIQTALPTSDKEYNVGLENIQHKPYFPPYTTPQSVSEPKQPLAKPQQTSLFDQPQQPEEKTVIIETDEMREAMDKLYGRNNDSSPDVDADALKQRIEEEQTEGFKRYRPSAPASEIDNFFSQKVENAPIAAPMSFEESTEDEYEFEDYFAIDKSGFFDTFNKKAQEIIDRNYQEDFSQEQQQQPIQDVEQETVEEEQYVQPEPPVDLSNLGRNVHAIHPTMQENEVVEEPEPPVEKNYKHFYKNLIGDQLDDESLRSVDYEDEEKPLVSTNPVVLEELADDLNKQGVKVKLFNRATTDYTPQSMLFTNKVNCLVGWLTYLSIIVEMLIVKLIVAPMNIGTLLLYYGIVLIAPVVLTVLYLVNPSKRVKPKFDFKYHFVNAIIAFCIATVLIFALNVLLAKIVFSDIGAVAGQIVLPIIIAINIPLYIVYYNIAYKKMLKV